MGAVQAPGSPDLEYFQEIFPYSWGNEPPQGKKGGNVADESAKRQFNDWTIFEGYDDGYPGLAPVKSFNPNDIGLFDMTGNVWE